MINFFRKIRKQLADDNKSLKYFRYAIGEIILVMIGILLALQVSNWNQNWKQLKQENKILQSLKLDFLESKERLLETMSMQKNVVRKSVELIKMYEGKVPKPINDSIIDYINFGAYSWYRAELLTGAYDAFINTGNSELIRNDQLTKLLAEYFSIVKSGFEDQENSMNLLSYMQNSLAPVNIHLRLRKNGPRIGLDTLRSPKESFAIDFLFKQDAFFGNLENKTTIENLRYNMQLKMLNHITQILDILDQEIKIDQ